jgi:hypothetical protein
MSRIIPVIMLKESIDLDVFFIAELLKLRSFEGTSTVRVRGSTLESNDLTNLN